jgi:putative endonuclease
MSSKSIGIAKEELACNYLLARGLQLIARNVQYRCGEIDLIMQDTTSLIFIEVRYRRNNLFGTPQESIGWHKQQRLRAAANQYLQQHPTRLACRFDVIAITRNDTIEWLQDAF